MAARLLTSTSRPAVGLQLAFARLDEPTQPDGIAVFSRLPPGHAALEHFPDRRADPAAPDAADADFGGAAPRRKRRKGAKPSMPKRHSPH